MDADIQSLFRWASFAIAIPVTFYSAVPFHRGALRDLKARTVGMDVPVSLAILSAFFKVPCQIESFVGSWLQLDAARLSGILP